MCEICKSLHELHWRLFSDECSTLLVMMNDIRIGKKQQLYVIKKMINIAIRATYYIFCCRNRNWDSPDLMQFWFLFVSFFFLFFFFFFFEIIQSQAAFVNLFTIVHSKTQTKFLLLLLLLLLFSFFRCLMPRLPISQFFWKNRSEMKCNLVEYEKPELHFRSSTSDLTHTNNNNNNNKTNKLVGNI